MGKRTRGRPALRPLVWEQPSAPRAEPALPVLPVERPKRQLYEVRVVRTITETLVIDAESAGDALERAEDRSPWARVRGRIIGVRSRTVTVNAHVIGEKGRP